MNKLPITELFSKVLSDEDFKNKYFLMYLDRFVYITTELENNLTADKKKKVIEDLLEGFNYLTNITDRKISPMDIREIGDLVNKDDFLEGFRKIEVNPGKYAKWLPVEPRNIYYSLFSLLDNYYNIWVDRDVYEKEAAFHINLMRIHPFEDGNKRVSKLILNANLVKQNYPPLIISEDETLEYYNYINNEDVMGFAKFLKKKSLEELGVLISYYKMYYNIPIPTDITNSDEERVLETPNVFAKRN